METVVNLTKERETKGTVLYKSAKDTDAITSLYIRKPDGLKFSDRITLTVADS